MEYVKGDCIFRLFTNRWGLAFDGPIKTNVDYFLKLAWYLFALVVGTDAKVVVVVVVDVVASLALEIAAIVVVVVEDASVVVLGDVDVVEVELVVSRASFVD